MAKTTKTVKRRKTEQPDEDYRVLRIPRLRTVLWGVGVAAGYGCGKTLNAGGVVSSGFAEGRARSEQS